MSARVLVPLHECGPGCTNTFTPLADCRCSCLGGHHGRDTGVTVEAWPARTIFLRNERDGDVRHGFAAVRESFGIWFVHEVTDVGVTRRWEPVAEIGGREAAEAHALALALRAVPAVEVAA